MRFLALVLCLPLMAGCIAPDDREADEQPHEPVKFTCEAAAFRPGDVNITFQTSKGAIDAVLYGARSPVTVCNLLGYIEADYYDQTIWHRICQGFVIQAGGLDLLGNSAPARDPIPNEAPESQLRNVKGSIAMARTAEPDSATTHFFVNLVDNLRLDYDGELAPGYAVFGNVTGGWDVVEAIASTAVVPSASGCQGRPIPATETTIEDIVLHG